MKGGGSVALFGTGALLISSSFAHAFLGWPAIRQALVASNVDPGLVQGIGVGWLYGSAAMLTFGVLTLLAWRSAGTGSCERRTRHVADRCPVPALWRRGMDLLLVRAALPRLHRHRRDGGVCGVCCEAFRVMARHND